MQTLFVRSEISLLKKNLLGYGWSLVDFSAFTNANELVKEVDRVYTEKYSGVGRSGNQIRRYFNLKAGDIVVIPAYRSICIATVVGENPKRFKQEETDDRANQTCVKPLCNANGRLLYIPRDELSHRLQQRLRMPVTIADLSDFKSEIDTIIETVCKGGAYQRNSLILEKQQEEKQRFKTDLLAALRNGNTGIKAGGLGLENLIQELLQLEGYGAQIQAKTQSSDISDVDIRATKSDPFYSYTLLIQAKHHSGETGEHGIAQLRAVSENSEENTQKWLISTAKFSDSVKIEAEKLGIHLMDGEGLVDWLYEHINQLSPKTKEALGIIDVPTFVALTV